MSVRFGNHDALHVLGAPHKTADSFNHGVVNSGGSLHSGHYQNKDGSFHPAGVKAMHQAIATVQFHGRGHETDRFFVKDDHMTDFYDNHYDENEIAKHTAQLRKGFKPPAKVNEETSVMKDVVSKLLEYSGAQFQDKMVSQDLNTERDKDKESGSMSLKSGTGMRGIYGTLGGAAAGALLRGKKEVKPEVKTEVKKDDKNDSGKTTPQETNKPSNTPPAQETVRAEPNPVTVSDDEKKNSQTSSGATVSPSGANESVFHIASVLHEDDDEDYSDDEISRDKDPNAAGGPYSEDDIKVTQDPRDAAPGMDPVGDPPTQQAKQITTGLAYKAPVAAGTMQTMLPGGEHDAIQKLSLIHI